MGFGERLGDLRDRVRDRLQDTVQSTARNTRVRILAAILLATTLAMTLAGVSAAVLLRQQTVDELDARLARTAEATAFLVAGSGDSANAPKSTADAVALVLARSTFQADESAVGLPPAAQAAPDAPAAPAAQTAAVSPTSPTGFRIDRDGRLIDRFAHEAAGTVVVGTATTSGTGAGTGAATVGARDIRYAIIPVAVIGDPAVGHVVVAADLSAAMARVDEVLTVYVVVAVITLVLIGLVGWVLASRLLHPIRLLRETAARITESDLDERIPVVGRDDVSQLTSTVNDMLDRLDDAFTSQRRLLDDVGHELKTPITIVRGHLELLDPADPREVEATRDLALDELDRMNTLVADIVELSAVGAGAVPAREPVDVADFTMAVFDKAAAISPAHRWVLGERAELIVEVDPSRMAQAWLQLADNAAKYSPPGSTIVLSSAFVDGDDPQLSLSVADEGPGVPHAMRERIFDRFTRGSEGRGIGGSGLGLSIVQAIATAHGGWAQVDDDVPDDHTIDSVDSIDGDGDARHGSVFSIRLPLAVSDDEPGDELDDELDDGLDQEQTTGPDDAHKPQSLDGDTDETSEDTTPATPPLPADRPAATREPQPDGEFPPLVETPMPRWNQDPKHGNGGIG
ncbi:sensor histidine kinase [Plantibacter sp. Mn2098]|uniref:sensor histidine kinase n=1 Tax=Plantibacter sp. Mn2098 TaxID=3395266 RepID=UPI003BD59175